MRIKFNLNPILSCNDPTYCLHSFIVLHNKENFSVEKIQKLSRDNNDS